MLPNMLRNPILVQRDGKTIERNLRTKWILLHYIILQISIYAVQNMDNLALFLIRRHDSGEELIILVITCVMNTLSKS